MTIKPKNEFQQTAVIQQRSISLTSNRYSEDHAFTTDQLTTQSCANHMIVTRATSRRAQPFQFTEHGLYTQKVYRKPLRLLMKHESTDQLSHGGWKGARYLFTFCWEKWQYVRWPSKKVVTCCWTEADLTVGHSCSGRRGPWPMEAPGRGARPENNGSCIEFMIYLKMILPQNH